MAADMRISNVTAKAACDAIVDLIDGGAGAGYVEIRTGAAPATCEAASSGTLLATLTLNDPAFGAAADGDPGGIATCDVDPVPTDSSADATGTAAHFRAFDSDDTCILQGTVGTSGEDMNLNSAEIQAGAEVTLTSWTITVPET